MRRVIKFRAWDTRDKRWTFAEMGETSTPEEHAKNPFPTFAPVVFDSNGEYELMQFTGLTDKHGKEIYEGDVLKRYGVQEPITVYWKSPAFVTKGAAGAGSWYFDTADEVEIIGNIYENPDLLSV